MSVISYSDFNDIEHQDIADLDDLDTYDDNISEPDLDEIFHGPVYEDPIPFDDNIDDREALELALDQPLQWETPSRSRSNKTKPFPSRSISDNHSWRWWLITNHISSEEIEKHPNLPWSRLALVQRTELPTEPIRPPLGIPGSIGSITQERLIPPPSYYSSDRHGVSSCRELSLREIDQLDADRKTPMYNAWNWYAISLRIDPEEIRKDPTRPWSRTQLSYNSRITLGLVYDYLTNDRLPNATDGWDFTAILSRAHDITVDTFRDNDLDLLVKEEIMALLGNPYLGPGLYEYLYQRYPQYPIQPKLTKATKLILIHRHPSLIRWNVPNDVELLLSNDDLTVLDIQLLGLYQRPPGLQRIVPKFQDIVVQI